MNYGLEQLKSFYLNTLAAYHCCGDGMTATCQLEI